MIHERKFTAAEKTLLKGLSFEEYVVMVLLLRSDAPLSGGDIRIHARDLLKIKMTTAQARALAKKLCARGRVQPLGESRSPLYAPVNRNARAAAPGAATAE